MMPSETSETSFIGDFRWDFPQGAHFGHKFELALGINGIILGIKGISFLGLFRVSLRFLSVFFRVSLRFLQGLFRVSFRSL
jgi:hypothetical protein